MANTAADYLVFSTQQIVSNYKLRTRAIQSQQVTVTNTAEYYELTVLVSEAFDGVEVQPPQLILQPRESKTVTLTYDVNFLETLPVGNVPALINFTATARPITLPPEVPAPQPPAPQQPILSTTSIIRGCTNANALNYNPIANTDDGNCIAKIFGCTDPNAVNFDINANVDNGSCRPVQGPDPIRGCTNPRASNYNRFATQDDGSCEFERIGCTDPTANNYLATANVSCTDCCTYGSSCPAGCTDPTAFNYNPSAQCDDGSCRPKIFGCTQPDSVNFNSNANVEDGSCRYIGCKNPAARNYDPSSNVVACPNDICCDLVGDPPVCQTIGQIITQGAANAQGFAIVCRYAQADAAAATRGQACIEQCGEEYIGIKIEGCCDASAANYNPNANDCKAELCEAVKGCTDQTAKNYNSRAKVDDGSCSYRNRGCTDPTALNYSPSAEENDGSCIAKIPGCTDSRAINYSKLANVDDGSCVICAPAGQILGCAPIGISGNEFVVTISDGNCGFTANYCGSCDCSTPAGGGGGSGGGSGGGTGEGSGGGGGGGGELTDTRGTPGSIDNMNRI